MSRRHRGTTRAPRSFGGRSGRVASYENAWAPATRWLSAVALVSAVPALWWVLSTAFNPAWMWVLPAHFGIALFWWGRCVSAHKRRHLRVRDWYSRMADLASEPESILDERVGLASRKFNIWRATIIASCVTMLCAIALALVPAWIWVLPSGTEPVLAIAPWYPAVALGGLWLLLPLSARAGFLHAQDDEGKRAAKARGAFEYSKALGISLSDWEASAAEFTVSPDMRTVVIDPLPISVRANLGPALERSVETILPGWTIAEATIDRVVLTAVDEIATPEIYAARRAKRASGGMIRGITDLPDTDLRPQAVLWRIADDYKCNPADVDEFARAQDPKMRLVDYNHPRREAVIAKLSPRVQQVRDRLASLLSTDPWAIECTVAYAEDTGRHISAISVARAPEILDPARRRNTWLLAARTVLEEVPDTVWRVEDDPAQATITLRRIADPLRSAIAVGEFNSRFPNPVNDPVESWRTFPFALTEGSEPVTFTTFHTLGVGQTGAGKGSIWWSIFNGLTPAARAGLVEFYAIDPKGAEAIGDDGQPLGMFEKVATTADEWADLINKLVSDMDKRKGQGRRPPVTQEQPLRIILIDELSALSKLDTDSRRAKEVMAGLLTIASQGRSLNTLLVGLVQAPQKELVGDLRDFMPMRVALRTATKTETDIVLGDGATEAGAEAHLIPLAAPGNGYASAGIGFMRVEGDPEPVRVRLPYTDDAQIDAWSEEFLEIRAARKTAQARAPT